MKLCARSTNFTKPPLSLNTSSTSLRRWASQLSLHPFLRRRKSSQIEFNQVSRHWKAPWVVSVSSSQSHGSVERNDAALSGPLAAPHPGLTAEDAIKMQLHALSRNDEPRRDHGLEVMYHFANAEGTLEGGALSYYFGFQADLYHFGHFCMKFRSRFKELIWLKSFQISEQKVDHNGQVPTARVQVQVTLPGSESMSFIFLMSKVRRGPREACWLTDAIVRQKM